MPFLPAQIQLRFPKTCEHDAAMEDTVFSRSGSSYSVKTSSPDLQLADFAPDTFQVDLEWMCRVNSNSNITAVMMDHDAYIPGNEMSSGADDFLAAVFEATALRPDSGTMDLDVASHAATPPPSSLADMHDPNRVLLSMAPPKRFYRRHWQSLSVRLLHRRTSKSDSPTRQVA